MNYREHLKDKKRIVVKVGSSSLVYKETGEINLKQLELLVRELCNIRNMGIDVVLVSSGAIAVGKNVLGPMNVKNEQGNMGFKQACAAIGQGRLMMLYQKLFAEYNHISAQILMTKQSITNETHRENTKNTFMELLTMGVIPIVNENDTVSTFEIILDEKDSLIGDNDTLSAMVASLIGADLLILLSDIDGLYTDDPRVNRAARFIPVVENLTDEHIHMGKGSTGSNVGTGGMNTKMTAARIAVSSGTDMIIANSSNFGNLGKIMEGEEIGTLFVGKLDESFELVPFIEAL